MTFKRDAAALRDQQNVPGSEDLPNASTKSTDLQRALALLKIEQRTTEGADDLKIAKIYQIEQRLKDLPPEVVEDAKQRLANSEIDTSPSRSLPTLGAEERPAWEDSTGVAKWAQDAYKGEGEFKDNPESSVRTVTASMTPEGKIGSIYFPGETRVRTTHASGPSLESKDDVRTVRFNVNRDDAWKVYEAETGRPYNERRFRDWLKPTLAKCDVNNVPPWATLVEKPDDALAKKEDVTENLQLIEIYKKVSNGRVETWHPSRGAAVKFQTDKQTISVLLAGLEELDSRGVDDKNQRNLWFYDFVTARLPNSKEWMRRPDASGQVSDKGRTYKT